MEKIQDEQFRDHIGTINKDGKRSWVFPKKPSGRFYRYRTWVSYVLLIFLLAAPFLKINGNQFLLFNVTEREFSIFGFPFWPQDFYLLVLSMIIGVVFVILFTVIFGRIFCGWICPQTIFLEMVFRKIEYWIDGDRGKQIRLHKQAWNAEKIKKRLFKWAVFFIISFLIANVFLAYLIGGDVLIAHIKSPFTNLKTLSSLLIFTLVFFFVFAWFREQVCIIACPYGRLQGVLLDNKTINIAYDYVRGEKEKGRAKFNKREDREAAGKGDCIDCKQCVVVCPTGIDIRNGTQLECINCTACMDECDHMMENVGLPKGLIRYTSEDHIKQKVPFKFSARIKAYSAVLLILIGFLVGMLFLRNDVEASILRLPGELYQHKENNIISNVYTFKVINKTTKEIEDVSFKLLSHKGEIKVVTHRNFVVDRQGSAEGTLFIEINSALLKKDHLTLKIGVFCGNELIETTKATFIGPRSYR
jgi:cytochrome c oxidase accessory protein FixG